jgi:hypothetical protein
MKRRIYMAPDSGSLEDCSTRPYSWDSPFCVVLHGNDELWQRYLDAERACEEARRAVIVATTKEPMTPEEQVLYDRVIELHELDDHDSEEWMRQSDEIEEAAKKLSEGT